MASPDTEHALLKLSGHFSKRQSSAREEGLLIVEAGQVFRRPSSGEDKALCAQDELKIESRIGKLERKIHFPDGQIFTTHDSDAVDAIDIRKAGKLLPRLEKFGWHLVPLAILTPIAAVLLYRLMIPALVSFGLYVTPDLLPQQIDKGTLASLDRLWAEPTRLPEDKRAHITQIFTELIDTRPEHDGHFTTQYNLQFRKMKYTGPNAFALPGGTIVLTDALVTEFDNDDVIAGILCHEIAHVEHEHSLRQIYRSLGLFFMITMIAGDAGPMLEDILLEGSALLSLSFSREHELEADAYAVALLENTDYTSDGLIAFFQYLMLESNSTKRDANHTETTSKSGKVLREPPNWFSTHPLHQDRIDNIRTLTKTDKSNSK